MGFNTSGAASGAAAGSSFGPWGALAGGVMGGFLGSGDAPQAPPPPVLSDPRTPGAVTGQYGSSYIDPITGQITYNSSAGNLSKTSLLNHDLQSRLMGYGGSNEIDQLIKQQQAKILGLTPWEASAGGTPWIEGDPNGPQPKDFGLSQFDTSGHDLLGGRFDAKKQAAFDSYQNALKTFRSNNNAKSGALGQEQAYLQTLLDAKAKSGQPNSVLDYLNHGPDNANYLQGQVTQQYKNAQLANQQAMAARGMGSSSMNEIGGAANNQNLALGILGAQNQAGQQNFANRNTMLNYLTGQNAADTSAEAMRAGLNNQQMAQGQGIGMGLSQNQTSKDAAQAGLNWQGSMANFNGQQAQYAQNQNNFNSGMGALGQGLGQYQGNQAMKNWLDGQNKMNSWDTAAPIGTNGAMASPRVP